MSEKKLPGDPIALLLGIFAILCVVGGCCGAILFFAFGLIAILPLIIAIIGIIVANRSLRLYRTTPEVYLKKSRDNVATARIINVIALIFSIVGLLSFAYAVITMGSAFYDALDKEGIMEAYESSYENNNEDYKVKGIDSTITEDSILILLEKVEIETDSLD